MGPPDRAGVVSCDAPKIFNNPVGFEQPLWQLELGQVAYSPKTRVFGTVPNGGGADKAMIQNSRFNSGYTH
jgi:hypothetical protein